MTDDQLFLANAYLDDELDAGQRQVAEADPAVMSEVQALRALRSDLRDVPPASSAVRGAAISAALAVWSSNGAVEHNVDQAVEHRVEQRVKHGVNAGGSAPGGANVSTPLPSTPLPSTRRTSRWASSTRWLGAAAAVAGLAFAGLILVRGRGSEDSASDAKEAAAVPSPASSRAVPAVNADSATAAATESPSALPMSSEAMVADGASDDASMSDDGSVMASMSSEIPVVPLPTLDFTESDLKAAIQRLSADQPAPQDLTAGADDFVGVLDCDLVAVDPSLVLGATTASNADPARPSVELIIAVDDLFIQGYAIDAETCLAVQSTPLDH